MPKKIIIDIETIGRDFESFDEMSKEYLLKYAETEEKIQEAKDSPTIQVLDMATVPEKKSGPRRGLIVVLAAFSALVLSSIWAFIAEYLAGMKNSAI